MLEIKLRVSGMLDMDSVTEPFIPPLYFYTSLHPVTFFSI